jgi:hypothetical protein
VSLSLLGWNHAAARLSYHSIIVAEYTTDSSCPSYDAMWSKIHSRPARAVID